LRHAGILVGLGIVLTTTIGLFGVFVAPKLGVFVRHGLKDADRLTAERDIRDIWIKVGVGVAGGFAAVLTWGRLELSRREHENEVSGQLTERFTRAIEQLGNENLDIRLGGIYGLERIARESAVDHGPIVEVLTTYVREHSPWPPTLPGQYRDEAPLESVPALQARAADIQATLTVIGRRNRIHEQAQEQNHLDLSSVDMRMANLRAAHLEGVDLTGSHLEGAYLTDAHLEGANFWVGNFEEADLTGAYLEGADLMGVHLERAYLEGAHLEGADLWLAHLENADLTGAHLEGAHLGNAHLAGADFTGANLEGADLMGANLEGANLIRVTFDAATTWPKGFSPSTGTAEPS
jgi:uncharacterized protein YjbI with pentapeptide repeats